MASQVYCFVFCKFFYVSAAVAKASVWGTERSVYESVG